MRMFDGRIVRMLFFVVKTAGPIMYRFVPRLLSSVANTATRELSPLFIVI